MLKNGVFIFRVLRVLVLNTSYFFLALVLAFMACAMGLFFLCCFPVWKLKIDGLYWGFHCHDVMFSFAAFLCALVFVMCFE